jgi:hypothetical protein
MYVFIMRKNKRPGTKQQKAHSYIRRISTYSTYIHVVCTRRNILTAKLEIAYTCGRRGQLRSHAEGGHCVKLVSLGKMVARRSSAKNRKRGWGHSAFAEPDGVTRTQQDWGGGGYI